MCVPGAVSAGLTVASTVMQGALGVNSSLAKTRALQEQQDAKYKQMVEGIRGRNIAKRGKTLRDQDLYKQAAGAALDTATRAYLKTDIELDQAISGANLAAQTNLANLIKGSGKGSAKGLGGSSGARIDMQAIKDWGLKDAATRHGIREKALGAEFNKEVDQKRAGDAIKIAGRELGVRRSTIFEGIPEGPEQPNQLPELAMNVGQGLFDLWASKSGPSPFNFPGDPGFDASAAFSGDPTKVLGGLGFGQNLNFNLATPIKEVPWSTPVTY